MKTETERRNTIRKTENEGEKVEERKKRKEGKKQEQRMKTETG